MRNSSRELLFRWARSVVTGLLLGSLTLGVLGLLLAGWTGLRNGVQMGAVVGIVGGLLLASTSVEVSLLSLYGRRTAENETRESISSKEQ